MPYILEKGVQYQKSKSDLKVFMPTFDNENLENIIQSLWHKRPGSLRK